MRIVNNKTIRNWFHDFFARSKEDTNKIIEVDIETSTKLLLCKCWDWSTMHQELQIKKIRGLQATLIESLSLAQSLGKNFEFHSKYIIPDSLKKWLIKKEITFFEG